MTTKGIAHAETAECPDCGETITLRGPIKVGSRVICPECGADLVIVETIPVELDWYFEEETDEDENW